MQSIVVKVAATKMRKDQEVKRAGRGQSPEEMRKRRRRPVRVGEGNTERISQVAVIYRGTRSRHVIHLT